MANTEVIDIILETTSEMFIYMLPIIGVMAGIIFITSFLLEVTLNAFRKSRS